MSIAMPYHHPIHRANAYQQFSQTRAALSAAAPSYPALLHMCRNIRVAGCYALLMDADGTTFNECLQVSGRAFLHFLPAVPRDERVLSRAAPLLDAIACGDFSSAQALERELSVPFQRNFEYSEDHTYFELLFEFAFRPRDDSHVQALLAAYSSAIEGAADSRLDLIRALFEADAASFDAALRQLIAGHADHYRRMSETGGLAEDRVLSEGHVFVEGLALIRLAERAGMTLPDHYPLIPTLAREDQSPALPPDAWRSY